MISTFYLRLIKRQWRLGAVRLFCLAVAIAVAVTFSINLLSDRLEQLFNQQAKEVLAADQVLESTSALSINQKSVLDSSTIEKAETVVFPTMASAEEEFLLVNLKAVSEQYPLRGQLRIADALFEDPVPIRTGPAIGKVWVEDRVLNALNITIGDQLTIGDQKFDVEKVLVYEPDRGGSFYSFTPRVMMHLDDLAATGVIQAGSRVKYYYLMAGESESLQQMRDQLSSDLQANQRFLTVEDTNATLATTLERAFRFLSITALIAVLLGAVGVALVSYQYAREMTQPYAILRCLGLHGKRLKISVILPLFVFSLAAILIGLLIGYGAHLLLLNSLGGLLPDNLPGATIKPLFISCLMALIVVVSFAWPFISQLLTTLPKQLLHATEVQAFPIVRASIGMMIGILILVQIATQEWRLSFGVIGGVAVFVALAYGLTQWIINLLVKHRQRKGNAYAKLGARMLSANRRMASMQIIAIGITFFALALIQTLRDDLLSTWQSKVPEDAPNVFAMNLFESDKALFQSLLEREQITHSPFYPVVRGRLTEINQQAVQRRVSKEEKGNRATERDLALTFSQELPKDNLITNGAWHAAVPEKESSSVPVSVEAELAERLEIKLGDRLDFTIATQRLSAIVTSLRSVEWESFTPNFYMMFPPGALDDLPITYLGSVHLEKERRSLMADWIKQFPNVAFFDVDYLLKRIQGITQQLSLALQTILYFSLIASLVIFISIELILYHYRSYSTAIYKALGAKTSLIQKMFRSQFILIGLIAGGIAYGLNLLTSFLLSKYFIEGETQINISTIILCLVITPLLVLIAGMISIQRTKSVSAKELLVSE
ncbi:MAG: ABC transporter permease [Gammaproteobacteria bacterium]